MTEPTDDEIKDLYAQETGFILDDSPAALLDFAHAVLAKWGTPAPVGVEPAAWRIKALEPVADCQVVDKGFRFDGEKQQHIPQLVIEFDPVPVNSPCDAKGWKDRDALAAALAGIDAANKGES